MKALVLLSGGNDSTAVMSEVVKKRGRGNVEALAIYYGQAHDKELESARLVAEFYDAPFHVYDLAEIFKNSDSALLKGNEDQIKDTTYSEQIDETGGIAPVNTYVPFRNGLMLSTATAVAIEVGASELYYGAHADDSAGCAYPDCSLEFVHAMAQAIDHGTAGAVKLKAPIVSRNKAQVLAMALHNGAPMQYTWSCYKGGEKQCGVCGTCRDRINAYKLNKKIDPVPYEVEVDWTDCEVI
ncbi:MAG: 7-cyano-7-deazaguanine synthase QueC [Lactobacillales bacterium]|jgi:7-cyano-7-deazaguanine synthase|nr:7-cyano-7-deazaguanine synthase QueC [Lactobacillales bacterium]